MNSRIILLIAALIALPTISSARDERSRRAVPKQYAYRFYLKDKRGSGYHLDRPEKFLGKRSIERRQRQQLPVDSTDLPIPKEYLRQLSIEGTRIVAHSKWNNTVVVMSRDSALLKMMAALPAVVRAKHVYTSPDSIEEPAIEWRLHQTFNKWDTIADDHYGNSRSQIEMLQGTRLHEMGLRGRGMVIAVVDGGFLNADRIDAIPNVRISAIKDFARLGLHSDDYTPTCNTAIDHGTRVLSAMAAQAPQVTVGTAPEARYYLLRSEEPDIEQPIEEDFWAMAVEWADSAGCDVINSSLGYNEYDDGLRSYGLHDLNGRTSLVSQTAARLAAKGIVMCNSAGNSGMGQWKKIGVPADAPDILSVGAVDNKARNAAFSSVGPTQDGRVKPDVMALGAPTVLISGRGTLVRDMGTSFATPLVAGLVACLWQGLPSLTAADIIEIVRQSASQANDPDNIYGYGIPDFLKAYTLGRQKTSAQQSPARSISKSSR